LARNGGNIALGHGGSFRIFGEGKVTGFGRLGAISLLTALALLHSTSLPALALEKKAAASSGMEELACKNGGREAKLSASRIAKGDRAYIEFRTRILPGTPSGHLYIVFGELGANAKVVSRYQTGLMPVGSIAGFYGGTLAPVPGMIWPQYLDCHGGTLGAWRVSVSAAQYAAIIRKARASLAQPPLWSMFGHNCNHFAAEFGDLAGLRRPKNSALPSVSYLPAYIEANK
jgi:hypothetical protein